MRLVPLLLAIACTSSAARPTPTATPPASGPVRTPLLAKNHPQFEGPAFKNSCSKDSQCQVGGCSSEICTAEQGVQSACVVYENQPRGTCGCVAGDCVWYGDGKPSSVDTGAPQGAPCKEGKCAAGLTCVNYYGIAGPRGPAFTSCEIRCALKGSKCPEGQQCITIADGPGQVCRPVQP